MDIANQIRTHRNSLGISQEELASRIFVSRQTVSNWETDRTYPDVQSLLLLSNLFGTTIDALVRGDLEMMQQTIKDSAREDAARMKSLANWMLVGTLAALVVGAAGYTWLKPWGWLLFFVPYAVAIVAALRLERIKKDNNIQTYREIVAFMDGETVDSSAAQNQTTAQRVGTVAVKLLLGAVAGAGVFALMVAVLRMLA